MLSIIKKELQNYFFTPIGYIFIGLFLEISSVIFYIYTFNYGELSFASVFYNSAIILTFIIGITTMNSFAGERKNGTYQLIMTSPKSITSIVLGKFFAGIIVIFITEMFSLIYLGIISYFGTPDFSNLPTALIGFLLLTMAYISFGIFASSLTESPIIAYLITGLFFFATMYLTNISSIFSVVSFMSLYEKFAEGIIPIEESVNLISFTIACILLTIVSLKRRKNVK